MDILKRNIIIEVIEHKQITRSHVCGKILIANARKKWAFRAIIDDKIVQRTFRKSKFKTIQQFELFLRKEYNIK